MNTKQKTKKGSIRVLHLVCRDVRNMIFWIAVVLNSLFLFWTSEIMKVPEFSLIDGLDEAYIGGMAGRIVPITVSVASVMRFYDELKAGIYRTEVLRTGKLRFVFQKVMEAFASGAFIVIATLIIYTVAVYVYAGIHHIPVTAGESFELSRSCYMQWIEDGKGMLVYLIKCIFLIIYGTVWAVLGVSLTVFISNKRVAVLFPYILKTLMELLGTYCLIKWGTGILMLYNLQLTGWTAQTPLGGVVYEACCLGVVFLLSMVIIFIGMERIYKKQG